MVNTAAATLTITPSCPMCGRPIEMEVRAVPDGPGRLVVHYDEAAFYAHECPESTATYDGIEGLCGSVKVERNGEMVAARFSADGRWVPAEDDGQVQVGPQVWAARGPFGSLADDCA